MSTDLPFAPLHREADPRSQSFIQWVVGWWRTVALRGPVNIRTPTRDLMFLAGVIAINYTLLRPSPVDALFIIALALSVRPSQIISTNGFIFFSLIGTWLFSLFLSSFHLIDDPEVEYYLWKITFAASISICACLVATHWDEPVLLRFVRVYVFSTVVAASLGTIGYAGGFEELTWAGRPKALLDDPNMYAAFLVPGTLGCLFLIQRGERRWLYMLLFSWLVFGILLSLSRAAVGALVVWITVYMAVLNRRNVLNTLLSIVGLSALIGIGYWAGDTFVDGFGEMVRDRLTLAKEYDLGHAGRYNRYALSIPFILENPLGMGLLQIDRHFPEPIHNILISSFLNYGWAAGFAFLFLLVLSIVTSIRNFKVSENPLFLLILFMWLSVMTCAFLHEAERWRHLWLFTGVVWGLRASNLRWGSGSPRQSAVAGKGSY